MGVLYEDTLYTLEDLLALKTAIKTGARRVEYQDKTVEYRTLDEMLRLVAIISADVGVRSVRPRRTYASVSKGVCR